MTLSLHKIMAVRAHLVEVAKANLALAETRLRQEEDVLARPVGSCDGMPAKFLLNTCIARDMAFLRQHHLLQHVAHCRRLLVDKKKELRQIEILCENASLQALAHKQQRDLRSVEDWLRQRSADGDADVGAQAQQKVGPNT